MTRRYAERTTVRPEKSRQEIEALLTKAGARSIATLNDETQAMIAFRLGDRAYRFAVPFPSLDQLRKRARDSQAAQRQRDQIIRSRWRALFLALKAKIEAARAGIIALDVALMPFAVLPGGATVADEVLPRLAQMHERGESVPLLPGT